MCDGVGGVAESSWSAMVGAPLVVAVGAGYMQPLPSTCPG